MYPIPKYLNKPMTFIGLELDEVLFVYAAAFYSYVTQSIICFSIMIVGVFWYMKAKRKYPQGFFRQSLYFASLLELDGYPPFLEKEFIE